jgi:hypothetical protein
MANHVSSHELCTTSMATLLRSIYSITSVPLIQLHLQLTTAQVSSVPKTPYLGFMSRIPVKYSLLGKEEQNK